jgi:hypothetical protein
MSSQKTNNDLQNTAHYTTTQVLWKGKHITTQVLWKSKQLLLH